MTLTWEPPTSSIIGEKIALCDSEQPVDIPNRCGCIHPDECNAGRYAEITASPKPLTRLNSQDVRAYQADYMQET